MDDEIINSSCFNVVECFDLTPSAAIMILDEDLESFQASDPNTAWLICLVNALQ